MLGDLDILLEGENLLQPERPLVLLAAGIGITPILSILQAALEKTPNRKIVLVHGCLNENVQSFRKTVDELAAKHPTLLVHHRYSEPPVQGVRAPSDSTGFVDAPLIESLVLQRDADYYFCGPKPFMRNIYQQLMAWEIPVSQVHFEFFGPRHELQEEGV